MFDSRGEREEQGMLAVQDDWIQYDEVPVRRTAVRGGGACAQRLPVVAAQRPMRPVPVRVATVPPSMRIAPLPVRVVPVVPERRPRLRLTRRGRVVLVALPALLVLSAALVAAATGSADASTPVPSATTVVVGTGDTLWSVAQRVAPHRDPRDVVAELERANGLRGAAVAAGEVLRLPAES